MLVLKLLSWVIKSNSSTPYFWQIQSLPCLSSTSSGRTPFAGSGTPYIILTDNGLQFVGSDVSDWKKELGIRYLISTPSYPQGNEQVEASSKAILQCLKKRLKKKNKWPEELSGVLWAYHTTIWNAIEETPFTITYKTKAIIPVQVTTMPNLHIEEHTTLKNAGVQKTDFNAEE